MISIKASNLTFVYEFASGFHLVVFLSQTFLIVCVQNEHSFGRAMRMLWQSSEIASKKFHTKQPSFKTVSKIVQQYVKKKSIGMDEKIALPTDRSV